MFQSKVLQSKIRSKNYRKTTMITAPMELKVGLGRQGGARWRGPRAATGCGFVSQPLLSAWCPTSPKPPFSGRREGRRVSQKLPRVCFFCLLETEHEKVHPATSNGKALAGASSFGAGQATPEQDVPNRQLHQPSHWGRLSAAKQMPICTIACHFFFWRFPSNK